MSSSHTVPSVCAKNWKNCKRNKTTSPKPRQSTHSQRDEERGAIFFFVCMSVVLQNFALCIFNAMTESQFQWLLLLILHSNQMTQNNRRKKKRAQIMKKKKLVEKIYAGWREQREKKRGRIFMFCCCIKIRCEYLRCLLAYGAIYSKMFLELASN